MPSKLKVELILSKPEITARESLTIAVRVVDEAGNTVSGANVSLEITPAEAGALDSTAKTTGSDGRAEFTFTANSSLSADTQVSVKAKATKQGYEEGQSLPGSSPSLTVKKKAGEETGSSPGFGLGVAIGAVLMAGMLLTVIRKKRM